MTQFHPFLWLGNSPLYIGTISFSCIQLSIRIYVAHCPDYCQYRCSDHWGTRAFLNYGFLGYRRLLLGREAVTNQVSILKSRDVTLPTKVRLVKAMVLPVVMSGCESWTIKKAERQRTDAFELWCWRRLLRVPWTLRRSNQPILKEINPEYSLDVVMLKLKLQHFDHLMRRAHSLEKTPMPGKTDGRRRRGRQRMRWLDGITNSMDMSLSSSGSWWWTGKPGVLQPMGSQKVGHDWANEWQVYAQEWDCWLIW